jgi:hypothetical protein
MADLTYSMAMVDGVSPVLKKVEGNVQALNKSFDKLRAVVSGFIVANAISNTLKFADSIQDLADATNLSTAAIMGFSSAVAQNGGTFDSAQQGLAKFTQTLGDAISGSATAAKAFTDIGISLNDIYTLSEEDLLKKTVDGLGKMESAAMRIAAQTAIFGKNARSVNFGGVAEGMGTASADAAKYASAIKASADAQQSLENNLKNMTVALTSVIQPLTSTISKINISVDAFEKLIKVVGAVGAVLAFSALGKAIYALGSLINTFVFGTLRALGTGLGTSAMASKTLGNAIKQVVDAVRLAPGAFSAAAAVVGLIGGALLKFASIIFRFLGGPWGLLITGIITFREEILNLIPGLQPAWDAIVAGFNKVKKAMGFGDNKPMDTGADEEAKKLAALNAKLQEQQKQRQALADEIGKTSAALKYENDQQLQNLALETRLIGKSEQEQEVLRATADLYKKQDDAIKSLIEKKQEWSKESASPQQQANIDLIDKEIAKVKDLTNVQVTGVTEYIGRLQGARLLEQDRINTLQRITDQLEKQKQLDEAMLQIRQSTQGQLDQAGFEKSQMGRSPLEKQFASIQEEARKAALEAGRAFAAQFNAEDMGAEDAKKLADGLDLIAQKYKEIADAQSANLAMSRSWEQGWADAFNNYMDNATNAAQRAGEVFSSITGNMNSAIDRFVETGKFSFGDFTRSIIQDLLKIELKAQATSLFKSVLGGAGGLLGGIGSIFGFANGGQPPVNKPSIVGENGPELFVPKTAGTVVPNGGFGGGQVINNYVTNNNVSAIDARSVAQSFAENRKTMLGTMQMAQKELPYGNR